MPVSDDCVIGEGTKIWHPDNVNLYGCKIGRDCNIGFNVEIGQGVVVGDRVRIGCGCFIPEGVTIEDDCNIMPGVFFCNDKYPPSHRSQWGKTFVRKGATLGARSVILPDVEIGEGALVGAASVVTNNVPPGNLSYGHPARDKGTFEAPVYPIATGPHPQNEGYIGEHATPGTFGPIIPFRYPLLGEAENL